MNVFLDLDGVLADFVQPVEAKYGIRVEVWDFDKNIPGVTRQQFWESCNEDFWTNLPATVEGPAILTMLERCFGQDNICLLSSPCLTKGCMEGKRSWIEKHLPYYGKNRQYFLGSQKHFMANPLSILVDDSQDGVEAFVKKGGLAISVPRPWNKVGKRLLEGGAEPKGIVVLAYIERCLRSLGFWR